MTSKRFKLIDTTDDQRPGTSSSNVEEVDWTKCIICQNITDELLQCPTSAKRINIGAGYVTLAENLVKFKDLQSLPSSINLSALDDGSGLQNTMYKNNAKWHKTCYLKYNSTELKRAQKRHQVDTDDMSENTTSRSKKCTRTSLPCKIEMKEYVCLFCGSNEPDEKIHEVTTSNVDIRVRQCALKLQDTALLAKLSAGDLVAQEAKYHVRCIANLYRKASRVSSEDESEKGRDTRISHGIALAELISYIEDSTTEEELAPVFKMSDLTKVYSGRIRNLGVDIEGRVHSTRLKNRLLAYFPDIQEFKQGRESLLAFKDDVGPALQKACDDDFDTNYMQIYKAVKIIRSDMFKVTAGFDGTFPANCQENSVPRSLLALVSMLLYGPDITTDSYSQETLSIAQMLIFNSYKRIRYSPTTRHHASRETPLHMYLGIMVHCQTRKRGIVDKLFHLGLSVSYDRVLSVSANITNVLCKQYQEDGFVCPPSLKKGLFTTAAVDNIDHNPSAITAKDSFHGTGISLFQHVTSEEQGEQRMKLHLQHTQSTKVTETLPESFASVRPAVLKTKIPEIPLKEGPYTGCTQDIQDAVREEYRWLERVADTQEDQVDEMSVVSWGAFHAKQEPMKDIEPSISALLPLFEEEAKSVAMIKHSFDVVNTIVQVLNPGQTPVIAFDQPLYALAKQIQWNWPEQYGEDRFLIMFGGLHIEMALFKTIGDWLECSGWTSVITQAQVASSGKADAFLKASHVTRTRRAHQVTACSLFILLKAAYNEYLEKENLDEPRGFEEWCIQMSFDKPHFHYWYLTMKLELDALIFIRAIREGNFKLYIDTLSKIIPWFFALDHIHYSRWLPVHVRDMATLVHTIPDTYTAFSEGKFVVHKSKKMFSAIAIDHAHEQNNAVVKSDGGAVGLTENPSALRRWMIAGPEMARLAKEFESCIDRFVDEEDINHHEQKQSFQKSCIHDVTSLVEVIEELGNPFIEDSNDLLVLDTKDIAPSAVIDTIRRIEKVGQDQYEKFIEDRFINRSVSVFEPIKKKGLPLFRTPPEKTLSTTKGKIAVLKSDVSLFSRLYISCQTRGGNLDQFFEHENHIHPPALSLNGNIRQGIKADLLTKCLEPLTTSTGDVPNVETIVIDGAAVVNMLQPGASRTFDDYSGTIFCPYIRKQLDSVQRVDVVWDTYIDNSLKNATRSKRGTGIRRRVQGQTCVPRNWQSFLRVDKNKTELFHFLSHKLMDENIFGKTIIATDGQHVLCNPPRGDRLGLAPCNQEEADTRIMVHIADAIKEGHTRVMIRTVDTDVVVIVVSCFHAINAAEIWVAFGTGIHFRYISIHELTNTLGLEKAYALPVFHAFTGCDTVSSFAGKGKKTAWDTWMAFNDVTRSFIVMRDQPRNVNVETTIMPLIERFVILMYDRTNISEKVNEARKHLFAQKGRSIEGIPPTQSALFQHTKRSIYQGGIVWGECLKLEPQLPSPNAFGWIKDKSDQWQPFWSDMSEASSSCQELIHCGCKRGCRGRCKCGQSALPCTALCACGGECE